MGAAPHSLEPLAGHQQELGQIEKLAASGALHNCESLCHLLRFLAEKSLGDPATPLNEYEIATEVFHRGVNFDPKNDATVRVNMGRLRSRIADFYAGEGAHDDIVVELPARSYSVLFLYRSSTRADRVPEFPADKPASASPPERKKNSILLAAIFVALAAITSYFVVRALARTQVHPPPVTKALAIFWKEFLDEPDGPLVVFSNAKFIETPGAGLRYFRPAEDPPEMVVDQYTGIGEVMGIDALNHLFFRFGREMRVRRALNI